MLNYVRYFFFYLWNEVGDSHLFLSLSDTSNLHVLSDGSKYFNKIYRLENFRANILKYNITFNENSPESRTQTYLHTQIETLQRTVWQDHWFLGHSHWLGGEWPRCTGFFQISTEQEQRIFTQNWTQLNHNNNLIIIRSLALSRKELIYSIVRRFWISKVCFLKKRTIWKVEWET